MNLIPIKASYSEEPIRSLRALSAVLRLPEERIRELAAQASELYRPVPMPDGSTRQVFDARPALKAVHERLKEQIFQRVTYPPYLTGSLKGRDYKVNAEQHSGKNVVITEDVKGFFPSVSADVVHDVWLNFFGFSLEVSELLTQLTTRTGALAQGAITSSYLANLALWRREPLVHAKLGAMGIDYSRYVDDITMSASRRLTAEDKSSAIAMVYGMLRGTGLKASRLKHKVFSSGGEMIVTKLIVNRKPSLPASKQSEVRAAVFQFERRALSGASAEELIAAFSKAAQQVGQLRRFHPRQAILYRERLEKARAGIRPQQSPANGPPPPSTDEVVPVPWD
jgi:hypothetical protein